MWQEFKQFILRGNVVDLAVGIVIGAAFIGIVNSLVNDILMPPIGLALNNVDFASLYINLSDNSYASLEEAQAAGAPTLNYGLFLNAIINFLIVAIVIFFVIKLINRLQQTAMTEEKPIDPSTKKCTYCFTEIPIKATRCPHCTSQLTEG